MAKWGEGDPRWIVEDRPDVANVNNWHWTEKNATPWSREFLQKAINDLTISDTARTVTFSDVEVEGEATANNRKSKLIFFYELDVGMKWTGKTAEGKSVNGKLKVLNVSEEYTPDEYEFEVSLTSDETPERLEVKEFVRTQGIKLVRQKLSEWYQTLRVEFTKGMILPTKSKSLADSLSSSTNGVKIHSEKTFSSEQSENVPQNNISEESRGSFEITDKFMCSPSDLFQCFVDEQRIRAYTQADASMECKIGGKFRMFGGHVSGTIKDLIPNERLVQAWRFESWPEGLYSEVTIKLTKSNGSTHLVLNHSGVPQTDMERTKDGWQRLQFDRIKSIFGFSSSLAGFL